jgi:hypothetical protein
VDPVALGFVRADFGCRPQAADSTREDFGSFGRFPVLFIHPPFGKFGRPAGFGKQRWVRSSRFHNPRWLCSVHFPEARWLVSGKILLKEIFLFSSA